jgi:SAM-dependent methyltransferase
VTGSSHSQAQHYNEILDDYDRHYYDLHSRQYRERFILSPLLQGVDLRGKRVADLASGSGETTVFLTQRFADVQCTGFDISPEACRRYGERTGRPARQFDLTAGGFTGEPFDAAIIMGGLHHCATDLAGALRTVASMLRPGGVFLLFEPNREYVLEAARQLWYRMDRYFDAGNEAALSHSVLLAAGAGAFDCRRVEYFGGPAFFLVYNSLVFRMPGRVKAATAPALMQAEQLHNRLASKWLCASFLAQWVRREAEEKHTEAPRHRETP